MTLKSGLPHACGTGGVHCDAYERCRAFRPLPVALRCFQSSMATSTTARARVWVFRVVCGASRWVNCRMHALACDGSMGPCAFAPPFPLLVGWWSARPPGALRGVQGGCCERAAPHVKACLHIWHHARHRRHEVNGRATDRAACDWFAEFLKRMFPKLEWKAFLEAAVRNPATCLLVCLLVDDACVYGLT